MSMINSDHKRNIKYKASGFIQLQQFKRTSDSENISEIDETIDELSLCQSNNTKILRLVPSNLDKNKREN